MNAVDELNFLLGIGPPRPKLPVTLQMSGYTSVRTVGKGSFGQAFLVFHKEKGEYYVVKHVNMANMTSRQRKDAHNEISVLQQLNHPNIVRYVECFEEHPHLYIVMEYADGGDLFTHLHKIQRAAGAFRKQTSTSLLTEAQVISLFVQTTMAVKYMHSRRLLHRDIKSQNVFLTRDHVVKLGDFGITTVLQNTVAMASTMCGTPCYFSPELCQGKSYNNKSDVWALGVLLYELCAGRLPFESTTMKVLMREIVSKHPSRIPARFSDDLWKLIQSMLQKDPKERPDAGQLLMTPVLMHRVPDIMQQLQSTQFTDINPNHDADSKAPPSKAVTPQPMTGNKDQSIAGTAPYLQLLAQQQEEVRQGKMKRNSQMAKDPFRGALPAGNVGGGYTSFAPPEGKSIPSAPTAHQPKGLPELPRSNAYAKKAAVPSPGTSRVPSDTPSRPIDYANAKLTPGQRAARDVLAAGGQPASSITPLQYLQPPKPDVPPTHYPPLEAPPTRDSSSPAATSISDLLAKFDAEKQRILEGKKKQQGGTGSGPTQRPPAVVAGDLGGMLREMSGHFSQYTSSAGSRPLRGEQELRTSSPETEKGKALTTSHQAAPTSEAAGSILISPEANTSQQVLERGQSGSGGVLPVAQGSPLEDGADNFVDPLGTKLDVVGLKQHHGRSQPAGEGLFSDGVSLSQYNSPEMSFQRSINRKFDPNATNRSQRCSLNPDGHSQTLAGIGAAPSTREDDETPVALDNTEMLYVGRCLCGCTTLSGPLSTIYGSFVCLCEACCRASGSCGGVEWLHLPAITHMSDISHTPVVRTISAPGASLKATGTVNGTSDPAGNGVSAALALRHHHRGILSGQSPSLRNSLSMSASGHGLQSYSFVFMVDEDTDEDEITSRHAGEEKVRAANFTVFFCTECGCMMGMLHDDTPGLLLTTTVLSAESHALLSRFAETVAPGE